MNAGGKEGAARHQADLDLEELSRGEAGEIIRLAGTTKDVSGVAVGCDSECLIAERGLEGEIRRIDDAHGTNNMEVLDWNESAIQLYTAMGAEFRDQWRPVLLHGDSLMKLAKGAR